MNWRVENSLLALFSIQLKCDIIVLIYRNDVKVVEYFHAFLAKEEGKRMYPDDSLTLHTDLYQINMMQVYFDQGIHNKKAVFEVYFRQQPFKNGYAVFAGLERIVTLS